MVNFFMGAILKRIDVVLFPTRGLTVATNNACLLDGVCS